MARRSKEEYRALLLDPRWQKMRLEVFARDKFTCQCCGADRKTLNAHHIFYSPDSEGPWDYDPSSIVSLCDDCHSQEHDLWANRNTIVFEALATAGFRHFVEMDRFWDMMTTMARAATDQNAEANLMHMIQCHLATLRERGQS